MKCAACGGVDEPCCRTGNTLFCDGGLDCNAQQICVND